MKNNFTPFSKIILCFLLAFSFSPLVVAQANCSQATAQIDLDANNIRARLAGAGSFWWDGNDAGYIFPNNNVGTPSPAAIFAGGLWLGGLDPAHNLKMAAQTYGMSSGQADYWPGPLDENGQTTADDCLNYDRFWEVSGTAISQHRQDFADNGMIDGPVPSALLAWPGRGNPHSLSSNGFDLPSSSQGLAPFFDANNDGTYDPMDGDYPNINDATEGIWWVFNDAGNIHTESNGLPLNFEIQVLAYAYESNEPAIDNTTFYDFKFLNRAVESIDSAHVGLWVDPDLGCYTDDYIGCDPSRNLAYVYNQDAIDGEAGCDCPFGVLTYCEEIPVLGIKILKGTSKFDQQSGQLVDNGLSYFTYYNNGGVGSPQPGTTDPAIAPEMYNYLTGSWRDGTHLTMGGNGYNPASTDFTNYVFPGSPNDPNGWSMCNEALPASDPRIILSSGPFSGAPGSITRMSIAVIMVEDVAHPCPDMSPLFEASDLVQEFYDNDFPTSNENLTIQQGLKLYPNPMSETAVLELLDPTQQIESLKLYGADGRLLRHYQQVNQHQLNVERNELGSGMYYYQLSTTGEQFISGKLLIQ